MQILRLAVRPGAGFLQFDRLPGLHDLLMVKASLAGQIRAPHCFQVLRFPGGNLQRGPAQNLIRRHLFELAIPRVDKNEAPGGVLAENPGGHLLYQGKIECL